MMRTILRHEPLPFDMLQKHLETNGIDMFRPSLRHCCLFAYGQTGSGKTHTVFGDPSNPSEMGVAFRRPTFMTL